MSGDDCKKLIEEISDLRQRVIDLENALRPFVCYRRATDRDWQNGACKDEWHHMVKAAKEALNFPKKETK